MKRFLYRIVVWVFHKTVNVLSKLMDWLEPMTDERMEEWRRREEEET